MKSSHLSRLAATAALAASVAACAPQQRLSVDVRDAATSQPVSGIAVKVTTLNPQHALRVSDYTRWITGGPAANSPASLTRDSGRTEVEAPTDRPFLVSLILPGLEPDSIYFRENGEDATFEATGWIDLPVRPEDVNKPAYQVRIAPAGDSPRS